MSNYTWVEDKRPEVIELALWQFYIEMNKEALEMRLYNTNFSSAHGMHHEENYSSAHDIAKLSWYAMKNSLFR